MPVKRNERGACLRQPPADTNGIGKVLLPLCWCLILAGVGPFFPRCLRKARRAWNRQNKAKRRVFTGRVLACKCVFLMLSVKEHNRGSSERDLFL